MWYCMRYVMNFKVGTWLWLLKNYCSVMVRWGSCVDGLRAHHTGTPTAKHFLYQHPQTTTRYSLHNAVEFIAENLGFWNISKLPLRELDESRQAKTSKFTRSLAHSSSQRLQSNRFQPNLDWFVEGGSHAVCQWWVEQKYHGESYKQPNASIKKTVTLSAAEHIMVKYEICRELRLFLASRTFI